MSGSPLLNALLETTNVADNLFYVIALNFRTLKRLFYVEDLVDQEVGLSLFWD